MGIHIFRNFKHLVNKLVGKEKQTKQDGQNGMTRVVDGIKSTDMKPVESSARNIFPA